MKCKMCSAHHTVPIILQLVRTNHMNQANMTPPWGFTSPK
jgi:hypothetical protein